MDGKNETRSISELSILPSITVSIFKFDAEGNRKLLLQFQDDGPLPDMQEEVCLGREIPNLFGN